MFILYICGAATTQFQDKRPLKSGTSKLLRAKNSNNPMKK